MMEASELGVDVSADNAIVWKDGNLYLLDQRQLPLNVDYLCLTDAVEVSSAIRDMVVRGAPAIGIAAAYAVVLSARQHFFNHSSTWKSRVHDDIQSLTESRPTAVNLFWALDRMCKIIDGPVGRNPDSELLAEAQRIHRDDVIANRRMGDLGAALIRKKTSVITHCNAGALATGGYGTALGVIRSAFAQDKVERVYADETRPWLQGARLTAWELEKDDIPVSLMVEGAAAARMRCGGIGWVIVGSDRIAANGDVANKVGTYSLAVAARHTGVKFMVVAPTSTIDLNVLNGTMIPIEERSDDEVLHCQGKRVAARNTDAWNPVFDVTPAELVDAIVTEKGVVLKPDAGKLAELMSKR